MLLAVFKIDADIAAAKERYRHQDVPSDSAMTHSTAPAPVDMTSLGFVGTHTMMLRESKQAEELPESVIGCLRCSRVDMRKNLKVPSGGSLGYDD